MTSSTPPRESLRDDNATRDRPRLNAFGQPVGEALLGFLSPPRPARGIIDGAFCRLEPLSAEHHANALYEATKDHPALFTYLSWGPFGGPDAFTAWLTEASQKTDPLFFAITNRDSGVALGLASFLRIDPGNASIEVGHLLFTPALARTRLATEAMYLMMRWAFDAGYRRYEWKSDALNAPSRRAAQRLGFTFEGIFRKAVVYKERSRDTAWFSIVDDEWPARRARLEAWLAPDNFDEHGAQRTRLGTHA